MIEKFGKLPVHWPLRLVQAMDLNVDDCSLVLYFIYAILIMNTISELRKP